MARALLYLRQSDSDGAGERSLSMDSQSTVLHDDAARLGWTVVTEIRDADLKGYDEQRRGLRELYDRCRSGDIDIVAFWKLDRLARRLRLQENVLHELDTLGVEVWSNQDPHIGTPLFRHVLGAWNEELTRMISANVRRSLREWTRRGIAWGPVPFGYERGANKTLQPSADAETLRQIYRWRADGRSLKAIVGLLADSGLLTQKGLPRWNVATIGHMLENPVYTGAVHLKELTVADAHEALIEPSLWEAVQARQDPNHYRRRREPRSKPHSSPLEGAILHGCGAPMYLRGTSPHRPFATFHCRGGPEWGGTHGYACQLSPRQLRAERAETLAWERLREDLAALRYPVDVIKEAERRDRLASPTAQATRRQAADRCQRLEAKRERWVEMYADGTIDRAKLDRELTKIDAEGAEVAAILAALPESADPTQIETEWQHLREIRDLFALFPAEARGQTLRRLGVAVVSPAGYRLGRTGDAGHVELRYRPNWARHFPPRDAASHGEEHG